MNQKWIRNGPKWTRNESEMDQNEPIWTENEPYSGQILANFYQIFTFFMKSNLYWGHFEQPQNGAWKISFCFPHKNNPLTSFHEWFSKSKSLQWISVSISSTILSMENSFRKSLSGFTKKLLLNISIFCNFSLWISNSEWRY